jgi:uncharacterized damage-inducible protein DinB
MLSKEHSKKIEPLNGLSQCFVKVPMTNLELTSDNVVERAFIQQARDLLQKEYVPKIECCLERLTDEQIWWRANSQTNSIGNLLLHLCGNARQWIVCGLGGEADNRERQAEFDDRRVISREELATGLRTTLNDVDQALARFDVNRLLDRFQIQGTEVTALTAIFHVTEHFSMHTGQVIQLTKMLADVDMAFYDFSSGKPVHTWGGSGH